MLIITIRTDKPDAEIGLYENKTRLAYEVWTAHRTLAETIHTKIQDILQQQHVSLDTVQAIVVFKGPGSFTGLRIGVSVANSMSYALNIPVVGTQGDDWLGSGIQQLKAGTNNSIVIPEYGALPHITQQKK